MRTPGKRRPLAEQPVLRATRTGYQLRRLLATNQAAMAQRHQGMAETRGSHRLVDRQPHRQHRQRPHWWSPQISGAAEEDKAIRGAHPLHRRRLPALPLMASGADPETGDSPETARAGRCRNSHATHPRRQKQTVKPLFIPTNFRGLLGCFRALLFGGPFPSRAAAFGLHFVFGFPLMSTFWAAVFHWFFDVTNNHSSFVSHRVVFSLLNADLTKHRAAIVGWLALKIGRGSGPRMEKFAAANAASIFEKRSSISTPQIFGSGFLKNRIICLVASSSSNPSTKQSMIARSRGCLAFKVFRCSFGLIMLKRASLLA